MNEQPFYDALNSKAKLAGINPLLLISGIEGLYTFRNVPLNTLNFEFLDSLILTIFALRIGDGFHVLAEDNLRSANDKIKQAAYAELTELTPEDIALSSNAYLQSFAQILNGKSIIRNYHKKALEVAALEVRRAQISFNATSIGTIIMDICKSNVGGSLDLDSIFSS